MHITDQVNSLIDVGVAAYAQLQKLKGHSLDSIENSGNKRNVGVMVVYVHE